MRKLTLLILLSGVLASCSRNYCYTSYEQARAELRSKRQHMKVMKRKYNYKPYKHK